MKNLLIASSLLALAGCFTAHLPNVTEWTPNRLRHSFATEVRKKFGIRTAGALLGHSDGSRITDGYSREAAVDELVREYGGVIEKLG